MAGIYTWEPKDAYPFDPKHEESFRFVWSKLIATPLPHLATSATKSSLTQVLIGLASIRDGTGSVVWKLFLRKTSKGLHLHF